jgi:uncharacterized protein with FMN-binding domain
MKRALLIAGGTVGGLGAVLSITPPALNGNGLSTIAGASAATSLPGTQNTNQNNAAAVTTATPDTKQSAAAVTTKKPTAKATATATKKATSSSSSTSSSTSTNSNSSASTNSATASATPSAPATKAAATTVSGTFTGDAINVGYGMVQVKITVSNGKITDASAVQAPSGRSQRFTDYSVPNLRQQTLSANSAAINGVSGASYTSYGWYKSLISALQKAGMTTGV